MKIGLRGGHSPNCKGAIGHLDEQTEVRKIYYELASMLQAQGHTVIDCNSNASTADGELLEGTNKANAGGCDTFISIHMNAAGGEGNGAECWLHDADNGTMNTIADRICQNFAEKGFQNRGRKYNTGFHDLNATAMPAMIIETLFCDNSHDVGLYNAMGAKGIAELVAAAVAGQGAPGGIVTPAPIVTPPVSSGDAGVIFEYAVMLTNGVILPFVRNLEDYAGLPGQTIAGIAVRVNKGTVRYRVHVKGAGWLPYVTGCDWNDIANGYAGYPGAVIDAVEVCYDTSADVAAAHGYQKAQYRVSPLNGSYCPWQFDNETGGGQEGYAGVIGQAMDRFQLY